MAQNLIVSNDMIPLIRQGLEHMRKHVTASGVLKDMATREAVDRQVARIDECVEHLKERERFVAEGRNEYRFYMVYTSDERELEGNLLLTDEEATQLYQGFEQLSVEDVDIEVPILEKLESDQGGWDYVSAMDFWEKELFRTLKYLDVEDPGTHFAFHPDFHAAPKP